MSKGFTLVELAIVLVIIGFLIVGILSGQELIKQANIRSVMTQMKDYSNATKTFQSKYNSIPGDINKAETLGISTNTCKAASSTTFDGNGDGVLQDGLVPS